MEKAASELAKHVNRNKLPLAVVELDTDNPVGIACLREINPIFPSFKPWLGGLAVNPRFCNKKNGEMLIETIKFQVNHLAMTCYIYSHLIQLLRIGMLD